MKKIIIDTNILKKEKIQKIMSSKIKDKCGKNIKLYISEVILKQRLLPLYHSKYIQDYDYYVDFIKTYCEKDIIDAASEIVKRELKNEFSKTSMYSKYKTSDIQFLNSPNNKIHTYDVEPQNNIKISAANNYKSFIKEIINEIANLKSNEDWKQYCYKFIYKYEFAVSQLTQFIEAHDKYNKGIFMELVKLWWKYATIAGTLRFFKFPNADNKAVDIVKNNNIPQNSFLHYQFRADDFIMDYCLVQNKKIDYDAPNDIIYISCMKDFDILLSDDTKFMKECFEELYPNKNKQILTLKEFLKRYG